MTKIEFDGRLAPKDDRTIVVEGKLYHYRTNNTCSTCSHENRFLYVKMIINGGSDAVVECPVCESGFTTKTILAQRAE